MDDARGGDNFIGRLPSKSNVLMARQISSVSGQVWILDNVRANSKSSRSSSMRPKLESFAIS